MNKEDQKIYLARSYVGWFFMGAVFVAFQGLQFPGFALITAGLVFLIILYGFYLLLVPKAHYNLQEVRIHDFPNGSLVIPMAQVACLSRSNVNWIEIRWEHQEACWNQRLNGSPKALDKFTEFIKQEKPAVLVFDTLKNEESQESKDLRATAYTYVGLILFSAFMIGTIFLAIHLAKTL